MTIHIGFTGTRNGMTDAQSRKVAALLDEMIEAASLKGHSVHAHHGDCVGADADFHAIARERQLWIVGHPPCVDSKRARCQFDEERGPVPYALRNRDIVNDCTETLIAAPARVTPGDRSGTWQTIRMAVKRGREVIIVGPEGDVHHW